MEAFKGQKLLIQTSNFPPAGYGSGSCAITSLKSGIVSLSSSPISCRSSHSFSPKVTSAKSTMNCARGWSLCTAAGGNWLCPSPSPPSREVLFRGGGAGNWSSLGSSSARSTQDFRELVLVAWHTPGRIGRGYFVIITKNPFDLGHRWRTARGTGGGESLSYKAVKISPSSILSWLRRKHKDFLETRPNHKGFSNSCQWRTPLLHRFFRYPSPAASRAGLCVHNVHRLHGVGAVRSSTSDYYNGFGSVSSQVDGSTASLENATVVDHHQLQQRLCPNGEREGFLATGYGWRVRDAARGELEELVRVADIQTDAFHEKSPLFDDLFYKIFHAEVLSSLQYKARHSDFDRYSCLLAETDPAHLDSLEGGEQAIVGAVDITAFADKNIVCHLPGAEEYLYVSGMAVESAYRRKGVATLLLEGCLARAVQWGFDYLVLHAYEDDFRARNLYSRAGYNTISADPEWMTKFFGRRRRVVMARRTQEVLDSSIS